MHLLKLFAPIGLFFLSHSLSLQARAEVSVNYKIEKDAAILLKGNKTIAKVPLNPTKDSGAIEAGFASDQAVAVGQCLVVRRGFRSSEVGVFEKLFETYDISGKKRFSGTLDSGFTGGSPPFGSPKNLWWTIPVGCEEFLCGFVIIKEDCSVTSTSISEQPSGCGDPKFNDDSHSEIRCGKKLVKIFPTGKYQIQGP